MKATKRRRTKFEELIYELLGNNPNFIIEEEKGGRLSVRRVRFKGKQEPEIMTSCNKV